MRSGRSWQLPPAVRQQRAHKLAKCCEARCANYIVHCAGQIMTTSVRVLTATATLSSRANTKLDIDMLQPRAVSKYGNFPVRTHALSLFAGHPSLFTSNFAFISPRLAISNTLCIANRSASWSFRTRPPDNWACVSGARCTSDTTASSVAIAA